MFIKFGYVEQTLCIVNLLVYVRRCLKILNTETKITYIDTNISKSPVAAQVDISLEAAGDIVFFGQSVHFVAPRSLYVSSGHHLQPSFVSLV